MKGIMKMNINEKRYFVSRLSDVAMRKINELSKEKRNIMQEMHKTNEEVLKEEIKKNWDKIKNLILSDKDIYKTSLVNSCNGNGYEYLPLYLRVNINTDLFDGIEKKINNNSKTYNLEINSLDKRVDKVVSKREETQDLIMAGNDKEAGIILNEFMNFKF